MCPPNVYVQKIHLGLDPEWYPGHDDDQASGNISVKQIVPGKRNECNQKNLLLLLPQPPFELEHNFQTCEVPYNGGGGECFANRKRHKESFRKEKF